MEYHEVTKERAQISLPIWQTHTATMKIGTLDHTDLDELIDGFEALVQARTLVQDDADEGHRAVARSLLIMKILSTKVTALIEAQLSENEGIIDDVNDVQ